MLENYLLNKKLIKLTCSLLFAFSISNASACNLQLQSVAPINAVYNPNAGLILTQNFGMSSDIPGCDYFIVFNPVNNKTLTNQNSEFLNYQLYEALNKGTILGELGPIPSINVLEGSLKGNKTLANLQYDFELSPIGIAPAGTYDTDIDLFLYEGLQTGAYVLKDSQRTHLSIDVAGSLAVYVDTGGGSTQQASLGFGILQTNANQSFDVEVIANTPYDLSIQSENSGTLANIANPNLPAIPYALDEKGKAIDLTAIAIIINNNIQPNKTSYTYTFGVTIGDVTNKLSGFYQDNLTLTVSAR